MWTCRRVGFIGLITTRRYVYTATHAPATVRGLHLEINDELAIIVGPTIAPDESGSYNPALQQAYKGSVEVSGVQGSVSVRHLLEVDRPIGMANG